MAQQDKQDFYWNGMLAGAINNLYYDLINVDVVHVPYATTHRNSSFFLKTRLAYSISANWATSAETEWFEITDVKIIRAENCEDTEWDVYVMWKSWNVKAIFAAPIRQYYDTEIWCVWPFHRCTVDDIIESANCGDWKLFVTDYVKWTRFMKDETIGDDDQVLEKISWSSATEVRWLSTWIQINQYTLWTVTWLFSDENIVNWFARFKTGPSTAIWNYLLVYQSRNLDWDGFAWQVRMITWIDNEWRLVLDSPRLWFRIPDTSDLKEKEKKEVYGWGVSYAIFSERWEVLWFTNNKNVEIMYYPHDCRHMSVYDQSTGQWWMKWRIVWVASASNKIFVLTKNWYIHYNKDTWWYNKFFINDDMFAGIDKISIAAFRDMVLAFWRKHIAIWVPDEQNNYWTMYDQSQTIWLWSRYSFNEYEWDLVFVSNDKRLLTLEVNSAWRYWLTFAEREWTERLNSKLSMLVPWDEVFVWSDKNNLRVFVNTSSNPYIEYNWRADISTTFNTSSTHIYKFDTLFKVRSEDHISWHLIKWATEWIYYWEDGIYVRDDAEQDCTYTTIDWQWNKVIHWQGSPYNTDIAAYLIENENNWLDWHPTLFQLAKLNRLITTLWPWVYSGSSKIKITSHSKWIWYTYEFPIDWDWNEWVWLMTSYYLEEPLSQEEEKKIQCALNTLQDWQLQYLPNCPEWDVQRQYIAQNAPRCEDYDELLTESHWVCINDKLYELAPTMPLATNLWENQDYSTQIKLELIWGQWDIICFGWRLAELYIAPLFTTGPDWEYQLQPKTDCE